MNSILYKDKNESRNLKIIPRNLNEIVLKGI